MKMYHTAAMALALLIAGNIVGISALSAENSLVTDDVNADSTCTASDVFLLQKWLLNIPDTDLAD